LTKVLSFKYIYKNYKELLTNVDKESPWMLCLLYKKGKGRVHNANNNLSPVEFEEKMMLQVEPVA